MIFINSIQETTGTNDSVVQSFYQNIFYDVSDGVISPFTFNVPKFTTNGGTTDYYEQNPLAIFTNLVKPFIRFDFSANTSSFGPDVYIKHDIYRIKWDKFSVAQQDVKAEGSDIFQNENISTETIREVDENTGEIKTKTINRTLRENLNSIKSHEKVDKNNIDPITNLYVRPTAKDIQDDLNVPIYSITASTTGITTSIYDLELDQFIKKIGELKTDLFQNKSQYIVDTNIIFNRTVSEGLYDLEEIVDGAIVSKDYKSVITTETVTDRQVISEGRFKDLNFVAGAYFSYLEVPDKPTLEFPTAEGQINSFTPEIFWSNGEKADEYLIQVSYNTGDTAFTESVFTYIVPKLDEFKEESRVTTKDTVSEFTSKKTIRKYEISLKSNSSVIYRVGNVNSIQSNLFGIRQYAVTFSDNRTIITQAEPIKSFVFTESDSPYTELISGLSSPPSLDSESPLSEYVLSGTVSGSTVTGATMQLVYPNASFVTELTDAAGGFEFDSLEPGTYTLNTTYRGYALDSRQVVISSDTNLNFEILIQWDNTYDIWATKESDIIKY